MIIEIETAIRKLSSLTVQVGRKSLQTITVDFTASSIAMKFSTGHTDILGISLKSARDDFRLVTPRFSGKGMAIFTASGQTASGVRVMPNIDYKFDFEIMPHSVKFSGGHDGYPSYRVSANGAVIYDHVQGHLGQLLGSTDIAVPVTTVAVAGP